MYLSAWLLSIIVCFFFFKQKTAYEMRISDWSSDVCSSDLLARDRLGHVDRVLRHEIDADALRADQADDLLDLVGQRGRRVVEQQMRLVEEEDENGRASCRERVGQYV